MNVPTMSLRWLIWNIRIKRRSGSVFQSRSNWGPSSYLQSRSGIEFQPIMDRGGSTNMAFSKAAPIEDRFIKPSPWLCKPSVDCGWAASFLKRKEPLDSLCGQTVCRKRARRSDTSSIFYEDCFGLGMVNEPVGTESSQTQILDTATIHDGTQTRPLRTIKEILNDIAKENPDALLPLPSRGMRSNDIVQDHSEATQDHNLLASFDDSQELEEQVLQNKTFEGVPDTCSHMLDVHIQHGEADSFRNVSDWFESEARHSEEARAYAGA